MSIIIGEASQSETKDINGRKGDQTGWEVRTRTYYNFGQNTKIRFKNSKRGLKAAQAMEAMCKNDNIGYGQADRTTLFEECRRIGWDIKKISKIRLCNGDCSEIAACAVNFAYKKEVLPSYTTTRNITEYTVTNRPKNFKLAKTQDFKPGDMCVRPGSHVFMIVSV